MISLVRKLIDRARSQGLKSALASAVSYVQTRVAFGARTLAYRLRPSAAVRRVPRSVAAADPVVTFVIPVYDREQMLIDCVRSVWAQGYPQTEVLLVLDGSPPGTRAVARQLAAEDARLRVIELPTQSGNAVIGRNVGISQARGEFVFFLDSDDLCRPGRIAETLSAFRAPDVDVVYGGYYLEFASAPERSHEVAPSDVSFDVVSKLNPIANSTAAVRRTVFTRYGMLKREMAYREDHELWLRLCYFGCRFKRVAASLSTIRIHGDNNEANFRDRDATFVERMGATYFISGPKPLSIVFLLPGLGLSGGIYVVLRHANALAEAGYDVAIMAQDDGQPLDWYPHTNQVRVLPMSRDPLDAADLAIATGWQTALDVIQCQAGTKAYFVQSDETRFVDDAPLKKTIAATYQMPFVYFTEARWIIGWLRSRFGWQATYVPNGVDTSLFSAEGPVLAPRGARPRVLLEGPLVISWKGVEDAYRAVADLDCEIWLVSSAGKPPADWRIDRFFERVPMNEMGAIYRSCDIFVKMSRVEGFFGPPLEAMACGCAVVVAEVTGADEFIVNGSNALVAPMRDISAVREHVRTLINDPEYRDSLVAEGYRTAARWPWARSFAAMADFVSQIPGRVVS